MRRAFAILGLVVLVILVALAVNALIVDQKTKPAKASAGSQLVDTPGGKLNVQIDGSTKSPPVVLIHGWTAATNWWDRMTPLLAKRYRVVRVDLLGHGGSAKPRSGYSMPDQADDVAAALEKLRVKRALVAGHSTGGEVAIALAARHPALVRKLIVMDTPAKKGEVTSNTTTKISVSPLLGELIWGTAPKSTVRDGLKQAFLNDKVPVPEQFVSDLKSMTYSSYSKTHKESGNYVENGAEQDDLRSMRTKPVMIVFGIGDRLIDRTKAMPAYRELLPLASLVTIPRAGHSPLWEQPALTARQFVKFDRAR